VDVSALVGPKTIQLTGYFDGYYDLLASQDDAEFVAVASFAAGGLAEIVQTVSGAFKSFRLRANARPATPVSCTASAEEGAGQNHFASLTLGVAVDTWALFPPTGVEEDVCFVCRGAFQGSVVVSGSPDGVAWNPVGFFRADRLPEGSPSVLAFSPLSTLDKVRYIQINLVGTATGPVAVTMGGRIPVNTALTLKLSQVYANGSAPPDQTLALLDAKGGPLVVDGTSPGFTGTNALVVRGDEQVSRALAVGVAAPTARVHPAAGTATPGTAPLKILPGVVLSTPESGAVEADADHVYWTSGSGARKQLDNVEHTPFYSTTTVAGLLTLEAGYSDYMVDGGEDFLGISTANQVAGDSVRLTFTQARWLRNGALVGAGFAPLLLLHVPGLAGYQDIELTNADGRCTFQLRADLQWQLTAGGFS
jgi:hypothetical protein